MSNPKMTVQGREVPPLEDMRAKVNLDKKAISRTTTGSCSDCDCFTSCSIPQETFQMMQEVGRISTDTAEVSSD